MESFVIDQELDDEVRLEASKFLLASDESEHAVDPETQARLEALLEAAGMFLWCFMHTIFYTDLNH